MMKMNNLTLGSLFDGSGGFPLGGLISGITPLWASEIEPFSIRVTTKRFPQVKHLGDITSISGYEIDPVDIITFGSPCQDMSIAGKRDGLSGSRSSLFYEAIRIIKEMRCKTNGRYPRFIVWENVPGAFSSNKGEDFRAVLEEVCKIKDEHVSVPKPPKWQRAGKIMGDDYSVAWRQLDAQFWGVPQRRKRIYLVADFAGWSAGKVLFESEGLSRYSKKSFRAWQEIARSFGKGIIDSVSNGVMFNNHPSDARVEGPADVSQTIGVFGGNGDNLPIVLDSQVFENHGQDSRYTGPLDVAQTVLSTFGMGGNNQPFVVEDVKCFDVRFTSEGTKNARQNCYETDTSRTIDTGGNAPDSNQGGVAVVYGICSKYRNSMKSANSKSGFYKADTSRCLDANGGHPMSNQGGMAVIEGNGARPSHKGDGYKENDVMYTLNATEQHGVAYGIGRPAMNQGYNAKFSFQIEEEVEPTIVASGASGVAHPTFCTSKSSFHTIAEEELANTLVATDYKDPPIINDFSSYGFYPQMKAECMTFTKEKSGCLVNGTNPGYQNGVLEQEYIVRRLTPTECARLQGFPDWWCGGLKTEEPTDEELEFWKDVFETHKKALGKTTKPKTDNQIRKWLKNPYSDSAEYKMWGNGVALPNVVFVLSGIAYYATKDNGINEK